MAALAFSEDQPLTLTNRTISGRTGTDSHVPAIELRLEKTNIHVRSVNGQCFWLTADGEQQKPVEVQDSWKRIPTDMKQYGTWLLHFAPVDRSHRLATFRFIPGERQS